MTALKYLSPEWTAEAAKRLREQLTPESMKNLTSSMITLYHHCPDGKERALYYKIENGVFTDISVREAPMPQAEFVISGDYETFAKISRAEIGLAFRLDERQTAPHRQHGQSTQPGFHCRPLQQDPLRNPLRILEPSHDTRSLFH